MFTIRVKPKTVAFWLALGVLSCGISLYFTSRYFGRVLEGM